MAETSGFLERPDGARLAWRRRGGGGPTVVWVGGYRSDMGGTKAVALDLAAAANGWAYLRFDHYAHGASGGDWNAATVGRWREDLLAVIDELIDGPVVLVGSSLGGWLSTLAAIARPDRVAALVLIAPAADFPEKLMWPRLDDAARRAILRDGAFTVTESFDGPYDLTRAFFDEARTWSVLEAPIAWPGPVRILQGIEDPDVPWRHAVRLAEAFETPDVVLELIKDGDHRLSRPQDLERLARRVGEVRTGP